MANRKRDRDFNVAACADAGSPKIQSIRRAAAWRDANQYALADWPVARHVSAGSVGGLRWFAQVVPERVFGPATPKRLVPSALTMTRARTSDSGTLRDDTLRPSLCVKELGIEVCQALRRGPTEEWTCVRQSHSKAPMASMCYPYATRQFGAGLVAGPALSASVSLTAPPPVTLQ